MTGWAATNTLRAAIRPFDYDDTPYNNADVQDALALVETALDLGDELRLWQPGRKGYAAAQERFFAALRAVRDGA